jgi:transporter family-2 protein
MQGLLVVVIFGLLGGVAVGLQAPLASLISQRIGTMESVFIIHFGGAIAAGTMLLVRGGGNLPDWRSVPWFALGAGVLGLVVVGSSNYAIPRIGVLGAIFLIVAGQLFVSTLIDQFGWLGVDVRAMDLTRLGGIAVLLIGVWIVLR